MLPVLVLGLQELFSEKFAFDFGFGFRLRDPVLLISQWLIRFNTFGDYGIVGANFVLNNYGKTFHRNGMVPDRWRFHMLSDVDVHLHAPFEEVDEGLSHTWNVMNFRIIKYW